VTYCVRKRLHNFVTFNLSASKSRCVYIIVLYKLALGRVSTGEVRVLCSVALNIILNIFPYFALISFCFRVEFQFYSRLVKRSQCYIIGRLFIRDCEVLAVISHLWTSFCSVSSRKAFLYINMISIML